LRAASSVTFAASAETASPSPAEPAPAAVGRPVFFVGDQRERFAIGVVAFSALVIGLDRFLGLDAPVGVPGARWASPPAWARGWSAA
jgi:hypothetical protein